MQAEVDLLTREVAGLQKQLAQSLKSVEKREHSAREYRESVSKLKRKLGQASSTISKLRKEAEARDKLIDTFSRMLLTKIGMEEEEEHGSIDGSSTRGEEKLDMSTLEQSLKLSME